MSPANKVTDSYNYSDTKLLQASACQQHAMSSRNKSFIKMTLNQQNVPMSYTDNDSYLLEHLYLRK